MSSKSDRSEIRSGQLDAVLFFLPIFERPGYLFGEWRSPEGQFPHHFKSPDVRDFVKELYRQGMVIPFDWSSWREEAQRYQADPAVLETADLPTLIKLLTIHVRQDRFVEGHLVGMLERGHITAILRRLKAIRAEMD